jgi:hypothetical protein
MALPACAWLVRSGCLPFPLTPEPWASLTNNMLKDEGARAVADALGNGWRLVALGLASNQIRSEGVSYLASKLHSHPTLEHLV